MVTNVRTRLLLRFVALLVAAFTLQGFVSPFVAAEEAKIGAIFPMTGPASHLGKSNLRGASIAIDLFNEEGGIDGLPLRLVVEDSQTEPRAGVAAFHKLVSTDQVSAAVITLTSVAMAVREIAERSQVIVLAESTHPDLTPGYDYTFRRFFTGDSGAIALSKFVKQHGLEKIAILHAEEEWGQTLASKVTALAKNDGFQIVGQESFSKSDANLRPQVLRIKNKMPDLVFTVGLGPPVVAAYRRFRELNVTSLLVGYVICGQGDVIKEASSELEATYSLDGYIDRQSEKFNKLSSRHQELYSGADIDQSTVVAFESINLIAEAMRNGAKNGSEIRDFILNQGLLMDSMGECRFTEHGDCVVPMVLNYIKGGQCHAREQPLP